MRLIRGVLTPQFIAVIASEYQDKGRLLFVATTNLDVPVGVILWASWFAIIHQMHEVFPKYAHIGIKGWKIDFIIRKSRPFDQEEFRRRAPVELHGVTVFIASPEDVVISKLEWARQGQSQRQVEDAASVLRVRSHSLDQAYIQKWVAELDLMAQWEEARRLAADGVDVVVTMSLAASRASTGSIPMISS